MGLRIRDHAALRVRKPRSPLSAGPGRGSLDGLWLGPAPARREVCGAGCRHLRRSYFFPIALLAEFLKKFLLAE